MKRDGVFEDFETVALRPATVGIRATKGGDHSLVQVAPGDPVARVKMGN